MSEAAATAADEVAAGDDPAQAAAPVRGLVCSDGCKKTSTDRDADFEFRFAYRDKRKRDERKRHKREIATREAQETRTHNETNKKHVKS